VCDTTVTILLASLGAAAQFVGVVLVVREIAGDRRRARALIDKQRQWKPQKRGPPRRAHASQLEDRSPFAQMQQHRAGERQARQMAEIVTALNRLAHETGDALDQRTAALLEEIDKGDKEQRDVLRYLLRGSAVERFGGVACILVGILLSLASTIVGTAG
jgi:hypothetical protein